jgi:hypothetical protein
MSTPKTAKKAVTAPSRPKAQAPVERVMFSREETAAMFGVTVRLLKRWQLAGKITATKPGGPKGPVFFTRAEIDRCLREWSA